ncbi:MAG: hypothetical protein AB1Z19_05855 [Eubacteriales bacterium]
MKTKITIFSIILVLFVMIASGCLVQDNSAPVVSQKPIVAPTATPVPTADAGYPDTIIQWMVPFGAGTNVDDWNRAIGDGFASQSNWRVMYTNISGGLSGSTGTYKVYHSRHDGYMYVGVSERSLTIPIYVEGTLTSQDWVYFIAGGTPLVLCSSRDIGLETLNEFILAAKSVGEDDALTIAAWGGGLYSALPYYFVTQSGITFKLKTFDTQEQAVEAARNAEVDGIIAPANAVAGLVKERRLIPLAVMDDKDLTNHSFYSNTIPSIRTEVPELPAEGLEALRQLRGFAVPADTPRDAVLAIQDSFLTLKDNEGFNQYINSVYGNMYLYSDEEAKKYIELTEQYLCWILSDMNKGGYTPEYVGIERPY